jgi:hypothetical protein
MNLYAQAADGLIAFDIYQGQPAARHLPDMREIDPTAVVGNH